MLDADKIVQNTLELFKDEVSKIKNFVSVEDYAELHPQPLTPTSIKVDVEIFLKDIERYQDYFMQWGKHHSHLPRYGLALVNLDGVLDAVNDPTNGSLYEWNSHNPDNKILECDCTSTTEVMDMPSLKDLAVFDKHWCRSNILKWDTGAEFVPHIDNGIPAPWLRLWGTTDSVNLDLRFYNKETKQMELVTDIEPGRIYIIDTSIVHDAKGNADNIYQFFLSVLPSAVNTLKELKNK
jgi:hypothetical protein